MGLAIFIWIVGAIAAVVAGIVMCGDDFVYAITSIAVIFGVIGGLFYASPLEGVDYQVAPYSTVVDGERLYFSNYSGDNSTIIIPTHYFRAKSFINYWGYCDIPIVIEILEGYNIIISNSTPKPVPHIVSGGCK